LYDVQIDTYLQPDGGERERISSTNSRHLYWTAAQQLAHHTINGCNLRTGDLLASGTISGPAPDSRGCLLELTWRGEQPLQLAGGRTRKFLQDGDTVTMTAYCQGDDYRVGFGEVTGTVLPCGSAGGR
jgi:fumarylacetoacetase